MKKIFKGLICLPLAGVLAAGTLCAAACNKSTPGSGGKIVYRDTETDALRLAIGAVDEKFNPMFYTSQNDGIIAGLTQVSLITADAQGNLAYGENYPTVALDYLETYYGEGDTKLATGDGVNFNYESGQTSTTVSENASYTTYEFLIKNGMMFSDGEHPLTVMDVLFNLYVYLDPLYNGSNTIYSTKIEGMQAYRQNNPAASDNDLGDSINTTIWGNAERKYNNLYYWAAGLNNATTYNADDLKRVAELYQDKLDSDWNSIATSYVESYKEYYFDEAWKAFAYAEGVIKNQTRINSQGSTEEVVDSKGKYLTELDPDWQTGEISSIGQEYINFMKEAYTDDDVAKLVGDGMSEANAILSLQKEAIVDYLYETGTNPAAKSGIANILSEGSFASTVINDFYQTLRSEDIGNRDLEVKRITGITVAKSKTFNGETYEEDHDILQIKVVGVDPKAKWNFGIAVAPMYYYSTPALYNAAMADYNSGAIYNNNTENFGVQYGNINFINNTLASSDKIPMGAGPYKCTTYRHGAGGISLNHNSFFYNYMAYFERNTQFETMGAGIENAKIKYVHYKVTQDDLIVSSLKTGEIDYGEPVATSANNNAVRGMSTETYSTAGYGYVGINPKYVKDITIRRAIMMAFDTNHIVEYYGSGLVEKIYRPMTTTSWVWAKGDEGYVEMPDRQYYTRMSTAKQIIDYIEANSDWVYNKSSNSWSNSVTGERGFSYSFTIAGESTDHPAYTMFTYAKRLLEQAGFKIKVGNDPRALQKLVTGDLEVWAAAWSSSIDPDPYQVYSMYSNASSTKNWNKDGIIRDPITYATEHEIMEALNQKIMDGRQTLDQEQRAMIYANSNRTANYEDWCALDLIMELAVEFPTYQRRDLCVWNGNVLDSSTMRTGDDATSNMGPISELWKVSYHVRSEEPDAGAAD